MENINAAEIADLKNRNAKFEMDNAKGVTFANNVPALYARIKGQRGRMLVAEFEDGMGNPLGKAAIQTELSKHGLDPKMAEWVSDTPEAFEGTHA